MQKWEYTMYYKSVVNSKTKISASNLWNKNDSYCINEDGKTAFDNVAEYGKEGWELVSVTPLVTSIGGSAYTGEILFIFKRPLEESPCDTI